MNLSLKNKLNQEVRFRNKKHELSSLASPDPIQIAHKYKEEYSALFCALLSYGNAKAIVKYLEKIDFSLLETKDEKDIMSHSFFPYRFQKSEDIRAFTLALKRLKQKKSLNEIFLEGFLPQKSIILGIKSIQEAIYKTVPYESKGYSFLIGNVSKNPNSTMKRWMMYLRWMVRKDEIDMGLWHGVGCENLLIPLDVHTHKVSQALGLLRRKSYDFKSVLILTEALRCFDPKDPVKYDFALYRLGQEKLLS